MMNRELLFSNNAKLGSVVGKDLATTTTGVRIKMDALERLCIVVIVAAGSAATFTPQFKQHNAASSGTSKALAIGNPYFHKVGAATSFTKVELSSKVDNIVLGAVLSTTDSVFVFEVLPEELDTNGGFGYASVDFPVAGVARLATVLLVAKDAKAQSAHEIAI